MDIMDFSDYLDEEKRVKSGCKDGWESGLYNRKRQMISK